MECAILCVSQCFAYCLQEYNSDNIGNPQLKGGMLSPASADWNILKLKKSLVGVLVLIILFQPPRICELTGPFAAACAQSQTSSGPSTPCAQFRWIYKTCFARRVLRCVYSAFQLT